jgi:hypothetical protein
MSGSALIVLRAYEPMVSPILASQLRVAMGELLQVCKEVSIADGWPGEKALPAHGQTPQDLWHRYR